MCICIFMHLHLYLYLELLICNGSHGIKVLSKKSIILNLFIKLININNLFINIYC